MPCKFYFHGKGKVFSAKILTFVPLLNIVICRNERIAHHYPCKGLDRLNTCHREGSARQSPHDATYIYRLQRLFNTREHTAP